VKLYEYLVGEIALSSPATHQPSTSTVGEGKSKETQRVSYEPSNLRKIIRDNIYVLFPGVSETKKAMLG
jgi:hypothetical protein